MTRLDEILDTSMLAWHVENGNVRIQSHPEFPELRIANYTDRCAYEHNWDDVTMQTRGLIWNHDTQEVLARSFKKFFNFDEKEAPCILDDQIVYAWDNKYDGSLGIMYRRPDNALALATRGSFASEQAVLGTELLSTLSNLEMHAKALDNGYTPLFEICGPDNRIVLRYDYNFIPFLGYISIAEGFHIPANPQYDKRTMRSLLGDLSRSDAEGWVVWKTAYEAVKLKQSDYVALHRIVTNLSEKEVWRQLRAGTYGPFVAALPDEWHAWADGIADRLRDEFLAVSTEARADAYTLENMHMDSRKEQAFWISDNVDFRYRGLVFSLLDGRDISDAIWRMIEPKGTDA